MTMFSCCSPRRSKISDIKQTTADFSSVADFKSDGIIPGKLCQLCIDMFKGLTSEKIPDDSSFDYHQNSSSLLLSIQAGCVLCAFMNQLLQRRDIKLDEDQAMSLKITRNGPRIHGWLHPERLTGICFMILTATVFEALPSLLAQDLGPENFPMPSDQGFSVATFNHCLKFHPNCRINSFSWKPTRLIKVDWNGSVPVLRLVAGKEIENESCYVALSHCWGRHPMVKLLLENRHIMEEDIPLSSLPKTFRDAISVIGWIKVSYIWIDSLCIIQDSVEDWRHEASLMGKVYQYAVCTISADCAADGTMGFLHGQEIAQPVLVAIPHWGKFWFQDSHYDIVRLYEMEPLAQRAWTLQERFMSTKILHFGTTGLLWECNQLATHQGVLVDFYHEAGFEDTRHLLLRPTDRLGSAIENWPAMRQWQRVVQDYCRRSLTMDGDKLVAFSGVAQMYCEILQDNYLAGLWQSSLYHELLWRFESTPRRVEGRRPSKYRAPSWSWASFDGEIYMTTNQGTGGPVMKILEAHTDPVGDDNTGQIKGGFIRVSGTLQNARSLKVYEKQESPPKSDANGRQKLIIDAYVPQPWNILSPTVNGVGTRFSGTLSAPTQKHRKYDDQCKILLQNGSLTSGVNGLQKLPSTLDPQPFSTFFDVATEITPDLPLYCLPIWLEPLGQNHACRGLILCDDEFETGNFRRVGQFSILITVNMRGYVDSTGVAKLLQLFYNLSPEFAKESGAEARWKDLVLEVHEMLAKDFKLPDEIRGLERLKERVITIV